MNDEVGTLVHFPAGGDKSEHYKGRIELVKLQANIVLVPNTKRRSDQAPDLILKADIGGKWFPFGSAWKQTADTCGEYLSIDIRNQCLGNERIRVAAFFLDGEEQPDPKKPDHMRIIWSPAKPVSPGLASLPGGEPVTDEIPF